MSLSIGAPAVLWKCPGCEQANRGEGWDFLDKMACGHCGKRWAECPNEDCYGLGEDCPTCGGHSGGLVEVRP